MTGRLVFHERKRNMEEELIVGVETFTLIDLLRKTAELKGFAFSESFNPSHNEAESEKVVTYTLDDAFLKFLTNQGLGRFLPDHENTEHSFLVGNQNSRWSFSELPAGNGFDLKMYLTIGIQPLNPKDRGMRLFPMVRSTGGQSCHEPIWDFFMFRALVEGGKNTFVRVPEICHELIKNRGYLVVPWADLGLGGIRSLSQLFQEFAGGNGIICRLADQEIVFDPKPRPQHVQPGERLFVIESAQPRVFQMWAEQLEIYRSKLTVPV